MFKTVEELKVTAEDCLKDEHPASENRKASEVSCLRNTRQLSTS